MAFESLTDKLQNVFKNLRSKGRLTDEDVKTALKEVKMALLEADVNFKVVKQFVNHRLSEVIPKREYLISTPFSETICSFLWNTAINSKTVSGI